VDQILASCIIKLAKSRVIAILQPMVQKSIVVFILVRLRRDLFHAVSQELLHVQYLQITSIVDTLLQPLWPIA